MAEASTPTERPRIELDKAADSELHVCSVLSAVMRKYTAQLKLSPKQQQAVVEWFYARFSD